MLQKGFLGKLSEWVVSVVSYNVNAHEKAERQFDFHHLVQNAKEPEKILGLFSEWLTFDFRHPVFDGKSALESFVTRNPLHLTEADLSAYRDMLSFEVGLFEVTSVEPGRGIGVRSIATNKKDFVHDISASWSVKLEDTVWTRIAPVAGLYHAVGSLFFVLPVVILSGLREAIQGWKRNIFDAHEIALWVTGGGGREKNEKDEHKPSSLASAEERFVVALKQCGMDGFFSLATYKKWLTNEKKYDLGFAARALFFLTPDTVEDDDGMELITASMHFGNMFPRKKFGGKSPLEVSVATPLDSERKFEMDTYARDSYIKMQEEAQTFMRSGEGEKAYHVYESIIQKLLDERIPFFHAFRLYANAALCCFQEIQEDDMVPKHFPLGEAILDASLRLNPKYDFGIRTRERHVTPYDDVSSLPKRDRNFALVVRGALKEAGLSKYRRTVFRRYEKFLSEVGVSLSYQTNTTPTAWRIGEKGKDGKSIKIGRNEPCYCNSGKKFKKCCGR